MDGTTQYQCLLLVNPLKISIAVFPLKPLKRLGTVGFNLLSAPVRVVIDHTLSILLNSRLYLFVARNTVRSLRIASCNPSEQS